MEKSEHQRIQTKTLVCEKEGMMEKLGSCNRLCKQCVDDDYDDDKKSAAIIHVLLA
jgi:hypothetical protein